MNKVDEFLYSINMHPQQTDMELTEKSFLNEMDRGLRGENSSLQMIPTYISAHGICRKNTPVITIDAGGTNLRTGLVTFGENGPELDRFSKTAMPGSCGEIDVDTFFDELAERILPLTEQSDMIGFCFSYPAEIFPDGDGRILQLNKEVRVKDAEGTIIGRTLVEKLHQKGASKPFGFTLLNDTAAGLMGGVAALGLEEKGGLAGFILGTGCNSCYCERGEKIWKLNNAPDMIINCESGIFDKAFRGSSDFLADGESDIPGDHVFEKMMSGAYHGSVITHTCVLAERKGLLSAAFRDGFEKFTTPELDDFLRGSDNRIARMCSGDDAQTLRVIIDRSFERAARLSCANIAALCLHCDGGKTPEQPFLVVAEGSTFYNSLLFRDKLQNLVEEHIKGELERYVAFKRAENSTMAGAALAALLNQENAIG